MKNNYSETNNFELQKRNYSDNFDATTVAKIDGQICFKSNPILQYRLESEMQSLENSVKQK